jgi:hypothetical protein
MGAELENENYFRGSLLVETGQEGAETGYSHGM